MRLVAAPVRVAAFLALSTVLIACSGCGRDALGTDPDPPDGPRRGGTAVVGSISDVDSWNEYLSRQAFADTVHHRLFLELVRKYGDDTDRPSAYRGELAESWMVSPDGRAVTFHLREATWSDGRPITAADVAFTWRAQTSPDVAWTNVLSKEHIVAVEAVDERTVTFRFDRVYPYQIEDASLGGILPEHVHGRVPFDAWRTHDWSSVRIASGPFVLEQHRPGEEIVLARNPRYHRDGFPRLDRVVIRIVPDSGGLLTQLLAGDVDFVDNIAPWDAERVRENPDVTLLPYDAPRYDYLGWNGARPPFDDPVVRRALTLAIDRDGIVEELLYGYGRVSSGPILSHTWGADPAIEPWPYDPREAGRLLRSRGFREGADGFLQRDGKPLEITLTTNAGNRIREAVQIKIQEQLSRVGIRVHLQPLEMGTFVHRNLEGRFDAYVAGWSVSGRALKELFGSDSRPPHGSNVVAYASAEVDGLLERLDAAHDWQEMKPILSGIQRRIHEDQPYTFLYEVRRLAGVGPRLRGVHVRFPDDPLADLEGAWVVGP